MTHTFTLPVKNINELNNKIDTFYRSLSYSTRVDIDNLISRVEKKIDGMGPISARELVMKTLIYAIVCEKVSAKDRKGRIKPERVWITDIVIRKLYGGRNG